MSARIMSRQTADMLIRVGQVYRAAVEAGRPPTRAVAERFQISHSAAANRVARARAAGQLPPTTRGKATRHGGRPI